MHVSVIPVDKTIMIDGVPLIFDFPFFPPNLHAVQWNGTSGNMEFTSGPATWFDNTAFVQPYIDAYNAEAARLAALPPA